MSKAFTRESDDDLSAPPVLSRASASLAEGTKNHITRGGMERLRASLEQLVQEQRPALASAATEDSDARRQLRALDRRMYELEKSILSADVIDSPPKPHLRVRFGATVTVRSLMSKAEAQYRIVGVDEVDHDRGGVSAQSPIARALLNAKLGERVRFRFPSGEEELEIMCIEYES